MNSKYLIAVIALGIAIGIATVLMPGANGIKNNLSQPDNNAGHNTAHLISNDKPAGGEFTLVSSTGEHSLSDFKGKLVLAYFGYTYCPDICPTNLGNLSIAYRQLTQEERDRLQILFISVDPERDTPARLKQYSDYFESNIIGMTGTANTIAEIAHRYGVVYAKVDDPNNGTNYAVDHSAFTYVIDQQGAWQEQLPHASTPDNFIKTIRTYLK